ESCGSVPTTARLSTGRSIPATRIEHRQNEWGMETSSDGCHSCQSCGRLVARRTLDRCHEIVRSRLSHSPKDFPVVRHGSGEVGVECGGVAESAAQLA